MNNMLLNLQLSDKETENLFKGIAIGSGAGIVLGAIVNNVGLLFAAGAVAGVLSSVIYSFYLRYKKNIK